VAADRAGHAGVGVCAWIYGDAPLEGTLARIAAAGYGGVELPGEPERWDPREVRRWLERYRLAPVALTASCKVPETARDLAHPDPAVRSEAVTYLRKCLEFAAAVGAPLAQMLPSGETRLSPIATREREWRLSVEGMRTAAREAERLGVRIAIEPLNRYEAYLVTTAASALAYLDDVGAPGVGMTLDLFHANIEERAIGEAIRAAGPRLWHLHAADTNRLGLGMGHLDVPQVAGALREVGYAGAVVLEVVPPGAAPSAAALDTCVRASLPHLRRLRAGERAEA
jgi:sugar phosphate isomerase/epimerase